MSPVSLEVERKTKPKAGFPLKTLHYCSAEPELRSSSFIIVVKVACKEGLAREKTYWISCSIYGYQRIIIGMRGQDLRYILKRIEEYGEMTLNHSKPN